MDIKSYVLLHTTGNLYWKDKEGRYLGCNLEFAKMANLKLPEEIVGKTDHDLFSNLLGEDGVKKLIEVDKNVIKNCQEEVVEELGINLKGEKAYYLTKKVPFRNDQGEIIGLIGTSIDITDLRETQKKLKTALKNEKLAKKVKQSFLENMCHDFRTPFSGLLGLTQTLMNRESNKKKKELLGIIAKSAEILLNDLNEIFNFLKLENGIPVLMKQFVLADVLHDISATSLPKAKEKNLEFKFTLDKKVPTHLIGDKFRTKRILENLVSNALKFTDHGEVVLKAELAKDLDKKLIVEFTIQDTGIGIPKDAYNFIFEPLSRISPSYEDLYEGKGFGLKLVKTFLEDLKGEIHINSTPNVGSIFQVFLPYKKTILDRKESNL